MVRCCAGPAGDAAGNDGVREFATREQQTAALKIGKSLCPITMRRHVNAGSKPCLCSFSDGSAVNEMTPSAILHGANSS
jgi:hypothetical protein